MRRPLHKGADVGSYRGQESVVVASRAQGDVRLCGVVAAAAARSYEPTHIADSPSGSVVHSRCQLQAV